MSTPKESAKTTVAAFFDADGTLFALPTLERRFLFELCKQRLLPIGNALRWLWEAGRLLPSGIAPACWANKRYLRGTSLCAAGPALEQTGGQVRYFSEAIERVCWHAERGHAIVIVSGTLEDLAVLVARGIGQRVGPSGHSNPILTCATQLEQSGGCWTGRVAGGVMRGRSKAAAARRLADAHGWKLADCWAYGDSASDRWILDTVGHAVAVNPGRRLSRLARECGWLEMYWSRSLAASPASNERTGRLGTETNRTAGQAT